MAKKRLDRWKLATSHSLSSVSKVGRALQASHDAKTLLSLRFCRVNSESHGKKDGLSHIRPSKKKEHT